jgi:predicted ATPase
MALRTSRPSCGVGCLNLHMLASLTLKSLPAAVYPLSVPAIRSLTTLTFSPTRITFFTGENGSGKSTLMEAIALSYGLSLEGGNRNFVFDPELARGDTSPLANALKLSFRGARTDEGFFFRVETLFNLATTIDNLGADQGYGGSLHARSHGEAFMTVLDYKFRRSGLFLLDEPEAALSPQRQLSFLILLHQTLRDHPDAQFLISTHSPILLGFPSAQILHFDDTGIHPIAYADTPAFQVTRRFLNAPEDMLQRLLDDEDNE